MPSEADHIRERFATELDYIEQFLNFMIRATDIPDGVIRDINRTLNTHEIEGLPERAKERLEDVYSEAELEALLEAMPVIAPKIELRIDTLQRGLPAFNQIDFRSAEEEQLFNEWTQWMIVHLSENPSAAEIVAMNKYAFNQAGEQAMDSDVPLQVQKIIIEAASRMAVRVKADSRVAGLELAIDNFETLTLTARATLSSTEINITRQAFILLMTAFDAAVFDLVRLGLRDNFFSWIGTLGKSDKLTFERIGTFMSFESMRDRLIEDQLKTRYLKDLLTLLSSHGVQLTDASRSEHLGHLIELVLRRNLHIHNRGIVDERYLNANEKGIVQFNVYGLAIGDCASISEEYWNMASRLCSYCVIAVANWVDKRMDKLPPT